MKQFLPLLLLLWLACSNEESESDNNIFEYNEYDFLEVRINPGALKLIVNDPNF
ncbi:MAG: hypothetical protein ACJZ1S_04800 [Candidatus Neomarinimicrobiota bacterium]|tara:strand:- start:1380 stop:1541 length:162 start_codon:yes stop_codon:yes gene_type:complete